MALQLYEESICSGCGMSKLLTGHGDFDGHFKVVPLSDCLACAAVARHEKKHGEKDLRPGEQWGVDFNDDYRRQVTDG